MLLFYKQHSFCNCFILRTCTKWSLHFIRKHFPLNLKCFFFLNEGTNKNYFQMVQNFLFLEDSVVDHFFISYLQQDTFHFTTNTTEGTKKSFINDHLACASAVEMKHFTVFVAAEYTCPWFISMLKFQQGKKWYVKHLNLHRGRGGGKEGKKGGKKQPK